MVPAFAQPSPPDRRSLRCKTSASVSQKGRFMQLFDGRTLDGWAATGNPDGWTINQGCIFCTADNGQYLY
jgi:hypothetical protein